MIAAREQPSTETAVKAAVISPAVEEEVTSKRVSHSSSAATGRAGRGERNRSRVMMRQQRDVPGRRKADNSEVVSVGEPE